MPSNSSALKPLLSVILPTYNVEKYIGKCIDSILNQTFTDFELLICDDGSIDKTREIIDTYKDNRIILTHNFVNFGKTKTVNRLFSKARGKYITVHDSDDWSDEKRFEKQITWLENNQLHIMCGTGYLSFDSNGKEVEKFSPLTDYERLKEAINTSGQFHGPTMMFRSSAIDDEFIYREYFNDYNEDTDLAYRLFQKGICTNINEPLYFYRILATSLCRKEYSIKNRNLYKVVVHLAEQRAKSGHDDLMVGNDSAVDTFFDDITTHYIKDKGLVFREGTAYYMYWKFHKRAISYSLKSIITSPLNILNWRTFFYCIRKTALETLK